MKKLFGRAAAFCALLTTSACAGSGTTTPALHPQAAQPAAQSVAVKPAAPPPTGFAGMRAVFEHSLIADDGKLIAAYAKQTGPTTIFVQCSGDDLISLIEGNPNTIANLDAMLAIGPVYLTDGDASWLATPSSVPADLPSLVQIAKLYPQLAGILFTINPEATSLWTSNRQQAEQNYITLIGTLETAEAGAFAQTWYTAQIDFATLPNSGGTKSPSLLGQLQTTQGVSGLDVAVPGGSSTQELTNLRNGTLAQLAVPFWLESGASKYGKRDYHGVKPGYLASNLDQLAKKVAAANKHFVGNSMNGWSDLYNSLQSIVPQPFVFNGTLPSGPLVPASGTTYLGAYVDANNQGQTPQQTAAFETTIGRTLAYNMHFYTHWDKTFPGSQEADDVAHGRLPVIAWNCGDTDANVIAGKDDALIAATAQRIAAFGSPVMLRWFWEANLNDTNNPPRTACWDPNTDLPNGYFDPMLYIAAWDHVRSVFAANGATNVIWLWCMANAHGGAAQYYPGDSEVDWVAMDDYDDNNTTMPATFYIFANSLSQFQEKPFMVTETAAHAGYQAGFYTGAVSVLQKQFPWVRALGDLDSEGTFQDWIFDAPGLAAFTTFADDPYMSAMPSEQIRGAQHRMTGGATQRTAMPR